jgi:hypothetical protein
MKTLWRLVNFKREKIFVKQLWYKVDSNRSLPTCLLAARWCDASDAATDAT